MDKYFIDRNGNVEEHIAGEEESRQVHFPLRLAIQHGDNNPVDCHDFLLNSSKGKLFVETEQPFEANAKVKLHFYIPPKTKLLAEFDGRVIDQRQVNNVRGNLIKISDLFHSKLHKLEGYLEEKNHLVDKLI
jgi:hypothetical protein